MSSETPPAMSPRRRLWITRFIIALIALHLMAVVLRCDQWPLSNYSMFSQLQASETRRLRAFGVLPGGAEVLLDDEKYFRPLSIERMSVCLTSIQKDDKRR